jgi:hypothetical protein
MRTREELERELAAVEDAVLRTDHTDKSYAAEYGQLYEIRLALRWALGMNRLRPSERTLVRLARAGRFWNRKP